MEEATTILTQGAGTNRHLCLGPFIKKLTKDMHLLRCR